MSGCRLSEYGTARAPAPPPIAAASGVPRYQPAAVGWGATIRPRQVPAVPATSEPELSQEFQSACLRVQHPGCGAIREAALVPRPRIHKPTRRGSPWEPNRDCLAWMAPAATCREMAG